MSEGNGLRDNLYGFIPIPQRFMALIDTMEFQRLRYIKQLALATQVFPGAEHTRFTHSIGTFHLMRKVLVHFRRYFADVGVSALSNQKNHDAILAAALLHDIGHGPFSHVFEEVMADINKTKDQCSHLEWTSRIISDPRTGIHKALKDNFDDDFWKMVVEYINYKGTSSCNRMFASLISGQFDVDRMDYILRDAHNIGVTYGRVDIEKLILGLEVTVGKTGDMILCFREEYLSDLEEFLFSRLQMYRNIYYHPYKLCTEAVLRKIFREARMLYRCGLLPVRDIPRALISLFSSAELTVEEYCSLDDQVIMGAIRCWSNIDLPVLKDLAQLCATLFSHGNLIKATLRDYRPVTVERFKRRLQDTIAKGWQNSAIASDKVCKLREALTKLNSKGIGDSAFYIEKQASVSLYTETVSQETIYILKKDGSLGKLKEISPFISALDLINIQDGYGAVYLHKDILRDYIRLDDIIGGETIMENIEKVISSARGKIEIEKKYQIEGNHQDTQRRIINSLLRQGYIISSGGKGIKELNYDSLPQRVQVDTYFDTDNGELRRRSSPIRVRKIEDEDGYCWTFKLPTKSESSGEAGQLERFEEEERADTNLISDPENQKTIINFLDYYNSLVSEDGKVNVDELLPGLKPVVTITNSRTKLKVESSDGAEVYEMVFDDVRFAKPHQQDDGVRVHHVEIEIKSANLSRLRMLKMTSSLEIDLKGSINQLTDSKYELAWRQLYDHTALNQDIAGH